MNFIANYSKLFEKFITPHTTEYRYNKFISTGDIYGAINQFKEALNCNSSMPLIRSSIKLTTKIFYLIIITGINRLKLTSL